MKTTLYRKVNHNIRYYKLDISKTLFNNSLLFIEYGNIKYKNPTGTIKYYFDTISDAKKEFMSIFNKKVKRGYYI